MFVLLGHRLANLGHTLTQLIRSASLTGFSDLCIAQKVDPKRLAAAAGLPAAALADPDLKVESSRVSRLLELAAEKCRLETFGLRLAETRRLSNLGPVGLIARDQPSLRGALGVMRQYLWLHNEALSFSLEESDDVAILRIDLRAKRVMAMRQAVELSVGVLCAILRALIGHGWRPEATAFRHGPPADLSVHRRVFGKTPQFLQEFNGLVLRRADLETPLAAADPAMARQVSRYIEGLAQARPITTRQMVGELIVLLLPTGTCNADRVAAHFGVDRRTLHRRLAADGTSFRALLDEQRTQLALSLLRDARTCTVVAELTGFASVSTFSHWFRRRFGKAARMHLRASAA
ncbi:MAG: AraC family transcriptional regulator [Proteobacteria bacterium]|nr:AraC family transcriptional regulator [Pseudomonadota bacterium]